MDAKATRAIKRLLLLLLLSAGIARAQNSPYSDIALSAAGRPIAGAGISVCNSPGLATTAASVSSNLVTLTMSSNPITAGFAASMTLQVSGFTGGDTYLNGGTLSGGVITGGFTILSVTPTTIVYQLTHANASATSNGAAFQQGNISTPCAPLASITSDQAGLSPITQPGLASDNLGNYAFFAVANNYVIQYNGPGLFVRLKPIAVPCSGAAACTFTGPQAFTNLTVSGTGTFTGPSGIGSNEEGATGSEIGARIIATQTTLPTLGGYARGRILVPRASSAYVMTTSVTLSPYVLIKCEEGSVIDYQGTGIAFTFTSSPFIYESMGGLDGCKITNTTGNWTAGVQVFNQAGVHLWNTIIGGSGGASNTDACLLLTNDTSAGNKFSEKTNLNLVNFSSCNTPIRIQVTNGGDPSFAYMYWTGVSLSPTGTSGTGINVLNNATLNGIYLWAQEFLCNNCVALHMQGTSQVIGGLIRLRAELQGGATAANCISVDVNAKLTADYACATSNGNAITDVYNGTVKQNIFNDSPSNTNSRVSNSPQGMAIQPIGTAGNGYGCGFTCGILNINIGAQTTSTFPNANYPVFGSSGNFTHTFKEINNGFTVLQNFSQGMQASGSFPGIAGTGACATITTTAGGSFAGRFTCTGTTGASTVTITFAATAFNGWRCPTDDETTNANKITQSGQTTTTCVLAGTVNQNDVLTFGPAVAY